MRTTLDLDDDVLAAARNLAKAANQSLGKVLSELARKGLAPREVGDTDRGFPVFRVADGSPPITLDLVRRAEDDTE